MSDDIPPVPAARLQPSASYSFTMRLHMPQQGGAFARVAQAIADAEAMLGAIDLVRVEPREVVRDVTVACGDSGHAEAVVRVVRDLEGVRVDSVSDRTFLMHKGGKIEVNSKLPLNRRCRRSRELALPSTTTCKEHCSNAWARPSLGRARVSDDPASS